jgi:hypothetical protein
MKPLRKRHLQVWILLAILIPAGIISGYMAVPKNVFNTLLQQDKTAALPLVIKTFNKKDYSVCLRRSTDKNNYQLQWINKRESTIPSSLIYKAYPNLSHGGALEPAELLGRIETKGNNYFPLKKDSTNTYHFILYDIIHHQTIDTIKF